MQLNMSEKPFLRGSRAVSTMTVGVLLVLVMLWCGSEAAEARGRFFVPVGAAKSGFGHFTEPRTATAAGRAAARRASKRKCRRRMPGCGLVFGFALGLQPSVCAPGRYPTVIARISGSSVTALVVRSRSCE